MDHGTNDVRPPAPADTDSERWMRELLNGPVDAILWECDAEARYFTFISKSAEQILGYPVETWLNEPFTWANTLHPDDRESTVAFCITETAAGKDHQFEYRCVRPDGRSVWLHDRAYLVRDAEGKLSRLRGFMVDITQRKKAEERLLLLAEAGRVLAEKIDTSEAIEELGRQLTAQIADSVAVDLLTEQATVQRYSAGKGETMRSDVVEVDLEAEDGLGCLLKTGRAELIRLAGNDWSSVWVDEGENPRHRTLIAVPLTARRRVLGALVLARDATDPYDSDDLSFAKDLGSRIAMAIDNSRLFDKAQKANRAKDEFIAAVSHELRNPMSAILGWTSLMRGVHDADQLRDAIRNIEESAKSQARIVEDILDISRALVGKFRLDVSPVNPAETIEATVRAIQPSADENGVSISLAIDAGVGPVLADPDRLQQIVWNFLSNALKFTPAGGQIEVSLRRSGEYASIGVSDTGEGIDPELLPHVFDRFRQGDRGTARGGLGIGLAIVKHLVEMQGGRVEASSDGEGKGARFQAHLPLVGSGGNGQSTEDSQVA